jgi:hypothetical protein
MWRSIFEDRVTRRRKRQSGGGSAMTFEEILDQAIVMLQWAADRVGIATAGAVGAGTGQRQGPSRLDRRGWYICWVVTA